MLYNLITLAGNENVIGGDGMDKDKEQCTIEEFQKMLMAGVSQ
jgi:hypothetical protein